MKTINSSWKLLFSIIIHYLCSVRIVVGHENKINSRLMDRISHELLRIFSNDRRESFKLRLPGHSITQVLDSDSGDENIVTMMNRN